MKSIYSLRMALKRKKTAVGIYVHGWLQYIYYKGFQSTQARHVQNGTSAPLALLNNVYYHLNVLHIVSLSLAAFLLSIQLWLVAKVIHVYALNYVSATFATLSVIGMVTAAIYTRAHRTDRV